MDPNSIASHSQSTRGVESEPKQALPAYTNQRKVQKPKEFQYKVEKGGKAIAVLTLNTEGGISRTIPTYSEGAIIKGNVSLDLDRPDSIRSVTVNVRGQFITGVNPDDQINFIDISQSLWSRANGAPRNSTATPHGTLSTKPEHTAKFKGKLHGEYVWPFAIALPQKVDMPLIGQVALGSFAPPQTFSERNIYATVYYKISVRIVRGSFRSDRRMSTQFGYIPVLRPPCFPPLRLLAYQEGKPLTGPTLNEDEWHPQGPTMIQSQSLDGSLISINCTLYLSKPLAYTRSTVIPLCIKLECGDAPTLKLLTSPKGINVSLRRSVKCGIPEKKANAKVVVYKEVIDDSIPAVWWPSTLGADEARSQDGVRFVNGEIHLKSDLKPTSDMPLLQVQYSVVLLPFTVPGFTHSETGPIFQVPVQIMTAYAPGPRPVKSAPPGYDIDVTLASTHK
ncbi:hypothetical protein HYPSUDRAFT_207041 [Hypholoma sublateritium FD-334 SS-4]|uniref:Arrestin-like N-terminal domain-containing protein n=1 Tax=Hypholoma sublateritium (strain FD-334 SS-4) TaxID=945553 RepID=A0A0D2P7U9_HYPSF|nr:hypothetical protein HYPSUDRAFT_207041 [Hypholoma sublateritium FD-334 SS-4]